MVLPTNLCESTLSMFRVASHFSDRSCTRVAISSFCPTRESCRKFVPCKWMQSKTSRFPPKKGSVPCCQTFDCTSPPPPSPSQQLLHILKGFWDVRNESFLEFAFHSHPSLSFHLHIITWISQLQQYPEVAIFFESKKHWKHVILSSFFSFRTSIFKSSTFCHSTFVWKKWKAGRGGIVVLITRSWSYQNAWMFVFASTSRTFQTDLLEPMYCKLFCQTSLKRISPSSQRLTLASFRPRQLKMFLAVGRESTLGFRTAPGLWTFGKKCIQCSSFPTKVQSFQCCTF